MILVIGCGRLGSNFAMRMAEAGHDVTVLDWDRGNFASYLPKEFPGRSFVGMEIDAEILRRAGIEESSVVVIVSRDEATNMMVADLAREVFAIERIIVRIDQPRLRTLYEEAGYEVLSPVLEAALSLERRVEAMGSR
ncbi:MAG: TrkA family potassium uptake protein [Candidatus Sericytochromatia bacterium]|nr:TrkA family potassium uptake protein [Candidatus Tanganyikabacteria bacterium]